jgi:hypothetical protein
VTVTDRSSLALRVFRIDVTKADKRVVDREWAALLDVKPGKKSPLSDKVSALWPAGPDKLLIEERDDTISSHPAASTKIYKVDFTKGTNLLCGVYDDPATSPTLEQRYIATADGVVPPDPADVTPGEVAVHRRQRGADRQRPGQHQARGHLAREVGWQDEPGRGQRQRLRPGPHHQPGREPDLQPDDDRLRSAACDVLVGSGICRVRGSRSPSCRRP